ncbi:unnamed protein product [Periconia digitata]|uniref:Uncharacterized protein n=1 Tax=Periconia digitata TaxID=1303443 RepID=A0A9W4U6Z0_9PLEO|nr:unnamed protein product [Periconia digitata]
MAESTYSNMLSTLPNFLFLLPTQLCVYKRERGGEVHKEGIYAPFLQRNTVSCLSTYQCTYGF